MREIERLRQMLVKAEIPFEWNDERHELIDWRQIAYPCSGHYRVCSVVQGMGTYGNNENLLEIMGLLTPEEERCDSVVGYLTAEEVFERIKKHFDGAEQNA